MRRLLPALIAVVVGCEPPPPDVARVAPAPSRPALAPVHEAAPPWSLTASDGSGLQLVRVDAKAAVEGPLAFTELHLYFHNPEARVREGTFTITLPAGAAVSRFAMENAGTWREAEVVDKAIARRVYDDFLHHKQDPALLEKAAGNQFSARVFPIPAKTDKHLVIAFSQDLAGRAYALPLRGLPKIERVDVKLAVTGADGKQHDQALAERNWKPDRDFAAAVTPVAQAVRSGMLVAGSFTIAHDTSTAEVPAQLTLLVDTSASRAAGYAGYVASIRALVGALRTRFGDTLALRVVAFDQDTQLIFDGTPAAYGATQDAALIERGAAGASDLAQALAAITPSAHPETRRVVVVTDGVMTAGPGTPELVAAIAKLPVARLDVALAGGIRDERLATAIARAGLPHAGDVYDLDRGAAEVATGLGESVRTNVAIDVPGAVWFYPKTIPAVRPGSPVMVYARLARPAQKLEVAIAGVHTTVELGGGTHALLDRAVANAEIDELETTLAATTDAKLAATLRADIARRSIAARVISSQTSMLVLETDDDYRRYQIARTAETDILVVGTNGLEDTHRASPQVARHEAIEAARSQGILGSVARNSGGYASLVGGADITSGFDDANLYGRQPGDAPISTTRYGTIGSGSSPSSGFGAGGGRGGMRGRMAAAPTISIGQPTVSGDLDKSLIRRYIKRNLNRITYCYERKLLGHPTLAGTIATQFTIAPSGIVKTATGSGFDAEVTRCVVDVIKTIEFPAQNGATIQVSYPFTFRTANTPVEPDPVAEAVAYLAPDPTPPPPEPSTVEPEEKHIAPLSGKLADVMSALQLGHPDVALAIAKPWHEAAPGDVLALVALGEVLEAKHRVAAAARIYGSMIDLFPGRADLRRYAGERLERLGISRALVIDTYRKAVADRPDHLTGHRLLAYALLRNGDHAGALAAILAGLDNRDVRMPPAGDRVLREDAGLIAAVYLAHGGDRDAVMKQLAAHQAVLADRPSTRFVLYWETDANDVDFHIRDSKGGHAWYSSKALPSGGELYADVTTGYGPECFTIPNTPTAGPYTLSLDYYSQGPMGYGMGLLQIMRFDGTSLTFDDRPYVIMNDHAFVELGTIR